MTESQLPADSDPAQQNGLSAPAKSLPWFVALLVIGGILVLIVLVYNALFPKAFWQSRELEHNRTKWESQHITHYRMSLDLDDPSPYENRMPLTVEVKDGKLVSVVDAHGQSVSAENDDDFGYEQQYFTIPGLFSFAYKTVWENPPEILISYDPALGYPASIYVDPYTEPCCQEYAIGVQDFQVLPP